LVVLAAAGAAAEALALGVETGAGAEVVAFGVEAGAIAVFVALGVATWVVDVAFDGAVDGVLDVALEVIGVLEATGAVVAVGKVAPAIIGEAAAEKPVLICAA
jgi:hypothetical protein